VVAAVLKNEHVTAINYQSSFSSNVICGLSNHDPLTLNHSEANNSQAIYTKHTKKRAFDITQK